MVRQSPRLFRAALLISCGLYLAACALPATDQWVTHDSSGSRPSIGTRTEVPAVEQQGSGYYETMRGFTCLGYGWLALFGGKIAWLANPLAFVGAVFLIYRRHTGAVAFGAVGLVVALLYVLVPPGGSGHRDVPRVGAWLWVGSFFALTSAAMIRKWDKPITGGWSVAIRPDGKTAAVSSNDTVVRLIDPTTGIEQRTIRVPKMGHGALAFSSDSSDGW